MDIVKIAAENVRADEAWSRNDLNEHPFGNVIPAKAGIQRKTGRFSGSPIEAFGDIGEQQGEPIMRPFMAAAARLLYENILPDENLYPNSFATRSDQENQ